jgi:hypothetical protein
VTNALIDWNWGDVGGRHIAPHQQWEATCTGQDLSGLSLWDNQIVGCVGCEGRHVHLDVVAVLVLETRHLAAYPLPALIDVNLVPVVSWVCGQ